MCHIIKWRSFQCTRPNCRARLPSRSFQVTCAADTSTGGRWGSCPNNLEVYETRVVVDTPRAAQARSHTRCAECRRRVEVIEKWIEGVEGALEGEVSRGRALGRVLGWFGREVKEEEGEGEGEGDDEVVFLGERAVVKQGGDDDVLFLGEREVVRKERGVKKWESVKREGVKQREVKKKEDIEHEHVKQEDLKKEGSC